MNKINKNVEILKFSGIAKVIEKANALGNDVIRLEVGDVDLDCPKEIREGIDKAFEDKKTHYPPLRGNLELIKIIVGEEKNKMNNNISESNIIGYIFRATIKSPFSRFQKLVPRYFYCFQT